jgi:hypothetical protein
MLDENTITKMKVAELKQELEDRQVEIPKGNKVLTISSQLILGGTEIIDRHKNNLCYKQIRRYFFM